MRVFLAIDLPDEVRSALEELQDDLPVGRIMAPETLHLTLCFLGEQDASVLGAVDEEMRRLKGAAFDLRIAGVGTFGGRVPRVLWAGVRDCPELVALQGRVRAGCVRAGVELRRERFRPHVTLARFGQDFSAGELERVAGFLAHHARFEAPVFRVEELVLFESVLHPEGAEHRVLEGYSLGG